VEQSAADDVLLARACVPHDRAVVIEEERQAEPEMPAVAADRLVAFDDLRRDQLLGARRGQQPAAAQRIE
jgi:hypothetical protein